MQQHQNVELRCAKRSREEDLRRCDHDEERYMGQMDGTLSLAGNGPCQQGCVEQ